MYSICTFFLSSFFFFLCPYFPWQTLAIHRIAGKGDGIIIFLDFHDHPLINIHLIHQDFCHFFLIDLFVITRLIADISKWHCEDLSSYQTTTLLLTSKCLIQLRLTPLATTVYLSHLPNPSPSHHLSSIRLPKCIRNEGCFIFYKRLREE